jgi:hypothetical protein
LLYTGDEYMKYGDIKLKLGETSSCEHIQAKQ